MTKTIRLVAPDWQGGNKQAYYYGAELLSWLAPKNDNQKEIKLDIEKPKSEELERENSVVAQSSVRRNVRMAADVLKEELPDKIITLGGNCLVSQAPFDYLHGKYGKNSESFGLIHTLIFQLQIYFIMNMRWFWGIY